LNDLHELAVPILKKTSGNAILVVMSVLVFVGIFLIDLPNRFWDISTKLLLFFLVVGLMAIVLKIRFQNRGFADSSHDAEGNSNTGDSSDGVVFLPRSSFGGDGNSDSDSFELEVSTNSLGVSEGNREFEDSVEVANKLKTDSKTELEEESTDYDIRSLKLADVEHKLDSELSFRRFLINITNTIHSEFKSFSSFFFLVNHIERACIVKVSLSQSEHFFKERAIYFEEPEGEILNTVIKEKCPLVINDLDEKFRKLPYYTDVEEVKSICIVPIIMNKVVIGLLGIDHKKKSRYSDNDIEVLRSHSTLIEEFIGNVEQVYKCENVLNTISSLFDISERLNSGLTVDEVIDIFSRVLSKSIKFDRVFVSLKNPRTNTGHVVRVLGDGDGFDETTEFFLKGNLNGSLIKTGELIYIKDLKSHHRFFPRFNSDEQQEEQYRTFYGLPLAVRHECFGAVSIESKSPDCYDRTQRQFVVILVNMISQALERAQLYDELETRAETDGLTDVFNHRTFRERLKNEIERSLRSGLNFSLLMIDIDHFKSFNDNYGHDVGDFVLRKVADQIKKCVRKVDLVARYGGEEFVVILIEHVKNEAFATAERLREDIQNQEFVQEGQNYTVTVSIGVAEFGEDSQEGQKLINLADQAMYEAKDSGRNCVVAFRQQNV